MDPDACLMRFLDALADGDEHEAWFAIVDLHDWLHRGGFPPTVSRSDENASPKLYRVGRD